MVTDGTKSPSAIAKKDQRIKIFTNPRRVKPTVSAGMMAATGDGGCLLIFFQSTPLKEVTALLKYTDQYHVIFGREIHWGQRQKEPSSSHDGQSFQFGGANLAVPGCWTLNAVLNYFPRSNDNTLSQTYVYSEKRASRAFTGAFDVGMFYLQKIQFKVREVPVFGQHHATVRVNPQRFFVNVLRYYAIRLADLSGNIQS